MSTLKVNNLQDINGANNSTPEQVAQGRAKAWVSWIGVDKSSGEQSVINDSYNVSSVTDQGTGKYLVNFSITFSNTNYIAVTDGRDNPSNDGNSSDRASLRLVPFNATNMGVRGTNSNNSFVDLSQLNVVIFGDG